MKYCFKVFGIFLVGSTRIFKLDLQLGLNAVCTDETVNNIINGCDRDDLSRSIHPRNE